MPVAIIVRAFTTEEIFRQPREFCAARNQHYGGLYSERREAPFPQRLRYFLLCKLCYVPTCDFCLSFWVSLVIVWIADYSLYFGDWRGFALATFVVMGVANVYLSAFSRLRVDLRKDRAEATKIEKSTPAADDE
ncbi:MAG TPA: hypothetical protein VFI31_09340 [Pirellulales bacterium]|nr:hypothetical protein [Pirellulales bacterium]